MKIAQIATNQSGLFALTDTGRLYYLPIIDFHAGMLAWTDVRLPAGCSEGPPPIPRVIPDPEPDPSVAEQATTFTERKIDLDKLPPKLRSALAGDGPTNICPQCGMPMRGGSCSECAITPAGGGAHDD